MTDIDRKWLDALENSFPVIGAVLPFYRSPDGSVDAPRTLQRYFELVGLKLTSDGRIQENQ